MKPMVFINTVVNVYHKNNNKNNDNVLILRKHQLLPFIQNKINIIKFAAYNCIFANSEIKNIALCAIFSTYFIKKSRVQDDPNSVYRQRINRFIFNPLVCTVNDALSCS